MKMDDPQDQIPSTTHYLKFGTITSTRYDQIGGSTIAEKILTLVDLTEPLSIWFIRGGSGEYKCGAKKVLPDTLYLI
jgi:hypothetical protein